MTKITIFKYEEDFDFDTHPAVLALAEKLTAAGILFTRHGTYNATLVLHNLSPGDGLLYVHGIYEHEGQTSYLCTVGFRREVNADDQQLEDHNIRLSTRHTAEDVVAYIQRNAKEQVDTPVIIRTRCII